MSYLLAQDHDVALESLTAIDPQPATIGYQFGRRAYALSGAIIDELPHVEFEFSAITVEQYQSLLEQFGLDDATTANVSVYVQDELYEWVVLNGTAVRPQIGNDGSRNNYFLRGFTILVKDLRAQA